MAITYQAFQQQTQGQDNLVERLQSEKNLLTHKVHQEGFELGIRSSSKLSYNDYRHFERVSPLADSFDEDVLDYLWSFLDRKQYPKQARLHEANFADLLDADPESRIMFAQGWLEGVLSIWETIKTQVDTNPEPSLN